MVKVKHFTITKPNPDVLIFEKSKLKHIWFLLLHAFFFIIWYRVAISSIDASLDQTVRYFVYLLPLLAVGSVIKSLKIVIGGESFTFDSGCKTILKNYNRIAII
ncbi:hypothetical protein CHISP_1192 [Chitinispirillum alkaliphilum]|nr:hypothetical protein CHISP_1192 [Chitinispirillum alkaliphilum]